MKGTGFFAELRRRRVVRVGLFYVVAAWVAIQVAETVFPHLGLPGWTITLVIALSALGLPFALLLAWVFDLTPEGVQRTGDRLRSAPAGAALLFFVGVALGLAGFGLAVRFAGTGGEGAEGGAAAETDGRESGEAAEARRSIAVLPFVNMSADAENEYFSDGLTEELLNALVQVEGLRVAARTSSFAYKGRNLPVERIGDELGVGAVLEGSVRRAGSSLRVTAQLIETESGYHLWSDTYDRTLDDVFAIQEELARSIVGTLKGRLLEEDSAALAVRGTRDAEAYDAYLQARHLRRSARGEEELRRALSHLDAAIARDPDFAAAWAEQAQVFIRLAEHVRPKEVLPRAKGAALRALERDSALVETRLALASVRLRYDWDWEAAEAEYRRAIALDPNAAIARHGYADFLSLARRFEEADAQLEQALALDSLAATDPEAFRRNAALQRGLAAHGRGDFREAIRLAEAILPAHPDARTALWLAGRSYAELGENEAAVRYLERVDSLTAEVYPWRTHLGIAYARAGRTTEAEVILRDLEAYAEEHYVGKDQVAALHYYLGRPDRAIEWMERAFDEHHWWLPAANSNPLFEPLREDPRFRALLRRMNAPGV